MNSIPRAPLEERLSSRLANCSGEKMLLKPEERLVDWMMDFVSEFCEAKDPVLDICASSSLATRACLQLSE